SVAFSPDGRWIVTASGANTAQRWDAESGKPVGMPLFHSTPGVEFLGFTPDGRAFATRDEHGLLHSWDTLTGQRLASLLPRNSGSVVPDRALGDKYLIATADFGHSWDSFATHAQIWQLARSAYGPLQTGEILHRPEPQWDGRTREPV